MLYAGQCNLMLCRSVQASKCFDIVTEKCSDENLKEKAHAYLAALKDMDANEQNGNRKEDTDREE